MTDILLDFTAPWCGHCIKMAHNVDVIEKEGAEFIKVERINVDDEVELARKYRVRSIPTLILLRDNQEIRRHVGEMTVEELRKFAFL